MAETVVTTLEVDSAPAEAGARAYESAMDRAREASDRATGSISQTGTEMVAMAAAATGAVAAAGLFLDRILSGNKVLADLQTQAHNVGLSLADLQGVKLGGLISGLSEADINTGLQKSAQLLNDASRNANTLSKELAENGIPIRNTNGQLISQNQLLGIAADLIKRARNPGDQNAIAEMLGLTRAWIPLLEQGGTAMAGLTAEAARAGAVISDETINRAAQFDREWRKSSVEFSAYMKSALLGLLPMVDDLIERASKFAKGIDWSGVEKAALAQLKAGADAVGLPDQAAVKFDLGSAPQNWEKLGDEVKGIVNSFLEFDNAGVLSNLITLFGLINSTPPSVSDMTDKVAGLLPKATVVPQQDVKWYSGTSPVMDTSDEAIGSAKRTAGWIAEGDAYKQLSALVSSASEGIAGSFSKVARTGSDSKGAVDRAEEALLKYVEVTKAAAASVDASIGEQERLKAVAQLTAAYIKDGYSPAAAAATAETNKWTRSAGEAAEALAKARTASQINFGWQTAFLSQEDASIAQALKGQYDGVAASLDSAAAAAMRTNNALRSISSAVETNLVSGLADITTGSKSVAAGMADMSRSVVRSIEEMIIKLMIVGPLMRAMQGALGVPAGVGGIALGGPSGPVPFYADGTESAAGGWSVVGERGPELVNLNPGAKVLPNGRIPGNDNGTSIIFHGGINISVPEGTSSTDGRQIAMHVEAAMGQLIDQKLAQAVRPRGLLAR